MDFEQDLRVFLEIEQGITSCPDDMVYFTDAATEEEILAFLDNPQKEELQMTTMEWRQTAKRFRDAYLYACFAYNATNDKKRAIHSGKQSLKNLIELFAMKRLVHTRMDRRLAQLRHTFAEMR